MRTIMLALCVATGVASANNSVQLGDGKIDGTKLQPYELSWRQCRLLDGDWVASNNLTERLIVIGDDVLRVQQFSVLPDGGSAVTTTYLDRHSLAPLRLERRMTAADGSERGSAEHVLTESGYKGRVAQGDKTKQVAGKANSTMLHGNVMGLPLATLDYQDQPLEFAASMISFDATYKVTASWVGRENLDFNGTKVEAWMVDVHWVHQEIGDVYPGGPDESGGRYWLVQNPPDGFPNVPRYKTDTYAVEFVPGVCP